VDPSRSRSCATTLVLVRGDTQTNRGRSFLPMLAQETAALRDLGLANVRFGAKSSRSVTTEPCPLYPRKRTKSRHVGTSALCQKRTYAVQQKIPAFDAATWARSTAINLSALFSARRRYRGGSCGCSRRCYDSRSRNVRAIYASSREFALLAPAATITRTCTISTRPQEPRTR
jgi:hypothetical protein